MASKYDWPNIKKEYVTGDLTYGSLSEKYGIRYKTLAERAASEGWVEQRAEYRGEVERKMLEEKASKKAKKIARDESKVSKVCDRLLSKISDMAVCVTNAKDLKSLTSALVDIQKIKGIKSDEDKQEQQARIKAMLHSVERDIKNGPQSVNVVITGAEEYAE